MNFYQSKVLSQKKIAPEIFQLEVSSSGKTILPGQFFMLKAWDNELPLSRPISVYKNEENRLVFLYRIAGKGTARFSHLKRGDRLDLLGPLGNGFPCDEVTGKIALVGGGIGIPPLFETAKKLHQAGVQVDLFLGYKDDLFIYDEFVDVCDHIFIACESGKEGFKGYVTQLLDCSKYDAVFTCGPEPMMFEVIRLCREIDIPVWASMEKHMACGIGACLVCNCETRDGMKRACKDGPVFRGEDLII